MWIKERTYEDAVLSEHPPFCDVEVFCSAFLHTTTTTTTVSGFTKQCWCFSLCANCCLQICIRTLTCKFFCVNVQFWILLPQRKMLVHKIVGIMLVDCFWNFCSRGGACFSLLVMESTFNFGGKLFGVYINLRNLWPSVSGYQLVTPYDQRLPQWVTCTFGKILWEYMQVNNFISRVENSEKHIHHCVINTSRKIHFW